MVRPSGSEIGLGPWVNETKKWLKSKKYFHLNPLFRVVRAPRSHDGVQFEQTFYVKQITKNMMMVIIITQKRKIPGRSITPPLHRIFILSLSAQRFKGAGLINQVVQLPVREDAVSKSGDNFLITFWPLSSLFLKMYFLPRSFVLNSILIDPMWNF